MSHIIGDGSAPEQTITRKQQDNCASKLLGEINADKASDNNGALTSNQKAYFEKEGAKYEKEGLLPTMAFHGEQYSLAQEVTRDINSESSEMFKVTSKFDLSEMSKVAPKPDAPVPPTPIHAAR